MKNWVNYKQTIGFGLLLNCVVVYEVLYCCMRYLLV